MEATTTAANDAPERVVSAHYTKADLGAAILAAVRERGGDPEHPTFEDLAPFDHYHGGSRPATLALLRLADPPRGARVLDVGGGIGGPARTLARDLDCHVTVLDTTPAFCEAGAMLTERTGLADRVAFQHGSALAMPFADGSFDLAWMQYVGITSPTRAVSSRKSPACCVPVAGSRSRRSSRGRRNPPTTDALGGDGRESSLPTEAELRDALAATGLREIAREAMPGLPPVPDHVPLSPLSHLIWDEAANRTIEGNIGATPPRGAWPQS